MIVFGSKEAQIILEKDRELSIRAEQAPTLLEELYDKLDILEDDLEQVNQEIWSIESQLEKAEGDRDSIVTRIIGIEAQISELENLLQ